MSLRVYLSKAKAISSNIIHTIKGTISKIEEKIKTPEEVIIEQQQAANEQFITLDGNTLFKTGVILKSGDKICFDRNEEAIYTFIGIADSIFINNMAVSALPLVIATNDIYIDLPLITLYAFHTNNGKNKYHIVINGTTVYTSDDGFKHLDKDGAFVLKLASKSIKITGIGHSSEDILDKFIKLFVK